MQQFAWGMNSNTIINQVHYLGLSTKYYETFNIKTDNRTREQQSFTILTPNLRS